MAKKAPQQARPKASKGYPTGRGAVGKGKRKRDGKAAAAVAAAAKARKRALEAMWSSCEEDGGQDDGEGDFWTTDEEQVLMLCPCEVFDTHAG